MMDLIKDYSSIGDRLFTFGLTASSIFLHDFSTWPKTVIAR
jgi:hypothetical protein